MRHSKTILTLLLFAAASTLAAAGFRGPLEIAVDCDRGDSLQKALDAIERRGGGVVRLSGTCLGTFVIRSEYLELIGEPAGGARIQAGAGPAILALGPGRANLRHLRLTGGDGIHARGAERIVASFDGEITAERSGVRAEAGAIVALVDGAVAGGQYALYASEAEVYAEGSRVHDSTYAAFLYRSRLGLDDAVVEDNQIGILATSRSDVEARGGRFANNGQVHLAGTTDSRLVVYNSRVGASGDPTFVSLYGDGGTAFEIFYDDDQAEIWGPATLFDDSFVSMIGSTIHGSVALREFSRLSLDGAVQDGIVDCQSAGDATCGYGAAAFTQGCAQAPPVCSPRAASVPEASGLRRSLRGRLPDLRLKWRE